MFEKIGRAVVAAILVLVFAVLIAMPSGFVLMLGLGAAHDTWPFVPALDYWSCVALLAAWRVVWPFRTTSE